MAEASVAQMSLTTSAAFLRRLQYSLVQQARVVLAETAVGTTHAARARYAAQVVASPSGQANAAVVMIAGGTNLNIPNATVIANADPNLVDSSATDAAILSQVATFWNPLAGIDTGN